MVVPLLENYQPESRVDHGDEWEMAVIVEEVVLVEGVPVVAPSEMEAPSAVVEAGLPLLPYCLQLLYVWQTLVGKAIHC
jgi:hypothetical protein